MTNPLSWTASTTMARMLLGICGSLLVVYPAKINEGDVMSDSNCQCKWCSEKRQQPAKPVEPYCANCTCPRCTWLANGELPLTWEQRVVRLIHNVGEKRQQPAPEEPLLSPVYDF